MTFIPQIIALDWSRKSTGVAIGRPGEKPEFSTVKFATYANADIGDIGAALLTWVNEFTTQYRPDIVILERHMNPGDSRGMEAAIYAIAADAIIKGACKLRRIRAEDVHRGTWTKFFLGNGGLSSNEAKKRGFEICLELGWNPNNYDESDAGGIWAWSCATYAGHANDAILPLMAAAQRRAR